MKPDLALSPPFRTYSITLAPFERRLVSHGLATGFFVPFRGLLSSNVISVGFGASADLFKINEGLFVKAPRGWRETVFFNDQAGGFQLAYTLIFDERAYIIGGANF